MPGVNPETVYDVPLLTVATNTTPSITLYDVAPVALGQLRPIDPEPQDPGVAVTDAGAGGASAGAAGGNSGSTDVAGHGLFCSRFYFRH